jgi:hypothetical protein
MLNKWPMIKSLLWKEFRELLPLIVVALATEAFLILGLTRYWALSRTSSPQDSAPVWPMLYATAIFFAIAAGFWQSARENFASHYQFLLHRPLSRETIFALKVALGAVACLLIVGLPLLWFAWWIDRWFVANSQEPQLSDVSWKAVAGLLLFYLGAFLSGVRPARWYVSRFLPFLAGILLFVILQSVARTAYAWTWIPTLITGPVLELCFAAAILHVARTRNYA